MFGFIKKVVFKAIPSFSCNALKFVSMNNEECKIRPEIINVSSDEPSFYPYSIEINKYIGSYNINDIIPDIVKSINLNLFNLTSRTDETRHIEWHETCKYRCR